MVSGATKKPQTIYNVTIYRISVAELY